MIPGLESVPVLESAPLVVLNINGAYYNKQNNPYFNAHIRSFLRI